MEPATPHVDCAVAEDTVLDGTVARDGVGVTLGEGVLDSMLSEELLDTALDSTVDVLIPELGCAVVEVMIDGAAVDEIVEVEALPEVGFGVLDEEEICEDTVVLDSETVVVDETGALWIQALRYVSGEPLYSPVPIVSYR